MEGYEKTEILGLNKITDTNIVDIDAIQENFNEVEKNIGKISDIEIDGFNQDIELSSEKSVANFIKFIWKKLNSIELTDLKVKVTTWGGKMLNVVLKELKDKDTEIVSTMGEYKASVDEYSKNLGVYVERHGVANGKLEKLLRG